MLLAPRRSGTPAFCEWVSWPGDFEFCGHTGSVRVLGATLGAAVAVALMLVVAAPASARDLSARAATRLQAANAPVSQLEQVSERRSLGATFIQVRQQVDGIPVLGSSATLSVASGGEDLLLDHTRPRVGRPQTARVRRAAAVAAARRAAQVRRLSARIRSGLAILPSPSRSRLVWRVVVPSVQPLGDFEVLVDARSRSIVRVRNLIKEATGKALVFDPNPVVEQGSLAGLTDDDNKDSAVLEPLYRSVDLRDLTLSAACPSGPWVTTTVGRDGRCPSDHDFSAVTRGSACGCFEAAMAYFHIDRMQRYLQSLGFTNVVHRSIRVNLHATTDDNSFYQPSSSSLNFGDGGVNDAQDADVIDHEYGHAIQDSQSPGFGDTLEGGAIGEGWGDYWEAAMSANQGNPDQFNVCFAEWDTSAVSDDALPCLRRVDLEWTLPQARAACPGSEIHCVGQAWSNTLWTIREALGAAPADKLIVQSQFSYAALTGFADGALALLFADRQLNAGANQGFLKSVLIGRGFVTQEQLDDEPTGAHPLGVPGNAADHLSGATDRRDVFALQLTGGRGVVIELHAGAGSFFGLTLYPPGTTKLFGGSIAKGPTPHGNEVALAFVPLTSGTYYLEVDVTSGSGDYTVQTFVDTDGDAQADSRDNCTIAVNPTQADWNGNGKGDACDRSSKTTIEKVKLRGRRLSVTGTLRPATVAATNWLVEVRRGKKLVARGRGSSKSNTGVVSATVTVPKATHGRLRVRAILIDPSYKRATSHVVTVTVP